MRLNLDARSRAILRRLPVANAYSLAELVLLALLAVQIARLTWVIVTPVAPLGEWRPAPVAVPADPAGVLGGFDAFFRGQPAPAQAVGASDIRLFGLRVDEASGRGSAIVAGPDGVQKSVSVGEEIVPGVKLSGVAFDHITLDRGGESETLYLVQGDAAPALPTGQDAPAEGAGPPPPASTGEAVSPDRIGAEIGFVPRIDGGRVSGLTVRPQGSGAAFRAAGLRAGDVVTALGGRPVSGQGDLQRVAHDYVHGGTVPLVVERGGQTLSLSLPVAPAEPAS